MRHLHLVYRLAGPPALAAWLGAAKAPWWSLGTMAILVGALAAVGVLLLHSAPLQTITWRNRLACWCLPWGHRFGGGSLLAIAMSSITITMLLGIASTFATSPWLLAAWIVDGALATWVLRIRIRLCHDRAQRRAVDALLLLLALLAGLGLVAGMLDYPNVGAAIAVAPPAALALLYGGWLAVVLLLRPKRWN